MHSFPLSSNSFDILNIPSVSQRFSKEITSKIFNDFSFSRFENDIEDPAHSPIFSQKYSKHIHGHNNLSVFNQNVILPKKNIKIKKFKCKFPHCQKTFINENQLKRHEKSRVAHEKMIYKMIYSKCFNAIRVEELLKDKKLKEIHKYCPEIFKELVADLKNKLKNRNVS